MSKLFVTGAAGHLGQRVVAHLLETQHVAPADIIVGTREPAKLAALKERGIEVRKLDFDDATSLNTAFAGVDRVLLISTDAVGRPGLRLAQHKAAIAAAKQASVKRIIYTSMSKPEQSVVSFAPDHLGTEQAIKASGMSWTLLRNGWYMENIFMTLPQSLATGKWFAATGMGRMPHVSREDCARAAAAALASSSQSNAVFDIAGPQSLTTKEIAALISKVAGKPIEVVQVSDEELKQGMIDGGVPEPFAAVMATFDINTRLGHFDVTSDDIKKLTGKAPQTWNEFLDERRATLKGA